MALIYQLYLKYDQQREGSDMRLIYLAIVVSFSLMALGQGLESIELSNARVANVDSIVDQAVRGE